MRVSIAHLSSSRIWTQGLDFTKYTRWELLGVCRVQLREAKGRGAEYLAAGHLSGWRGIPELVRARLSCQRGRPGSSVGKHLHAFQVWWRKTKKTQPVINPSAWQLPESFAGVLYSPPALCLTAKVLLGLQGVDNPAVPWFDWHPLGITAGKMKKYLFTFE